MGENMKKLVGLFLIILFLAGCSQEVTNGFNYVKGTADYLGAINEFKNSIPQLTGESLIDSTKREELKRSIEEMRTDIADFNALKPPNDLETLHQNIVDKNMIFDEKLQTSLTLIESGEKGSQKIKTLLLDNIVTDIIKSLTELGEKQK